MRLIPCKSCGAPLERHKCAYCGAFHHGEIKTPKIIPYNPRTESLNGLVFFGMGMAIVTPEWLIKLENA